MLCLGCGDCDPIGTLLCNEDKICHCNEGYTGSSCETCAPTFYRSDLSNKCESKSHIINLRDQLLRHLFLGCNCNLFGTVVHDPSTNGTCQDGTGSCGECFPGFTGPDCTICDEGFEKVEFPGFSNICMKSNVLRLSYVFVL